jgi:dihydropyrimidinase
MSLLIRNGTVVNADGEHRLDVLVEGETISRLEPIIDPSDLPADTEVIDATGKCVFPGFIDPHVHIHLPFMGTNAIDDHDSATRAALAGGTTTIIEMICPGPEEEPRDAFGTWKGLAEEGSHCDFSFHLSVVRFDELAEEQLRELVAAGEVASFKIFLAYKGALDIADENLFPLLELARELGVIVTAHCENAEAVDAMQARLIAAGKTGPEWHEPSRPRSVEATGVDHLCTFAGLTGAHVYIVHTSCGAALENAKEARAAGTQVWVESVAPHLVLDKSWAERPDFEGAKFVMSPPLRDAEEHDALWAGVADRSISTIGTDHAPFNFKGQKDMGLDAFTRIPNGIPSIQERVDLIHTHGVRTGRIDRPTFVDACSTQAARIFGMYPRKGVIAVGSDADIVVYDPDAKGTFRHADSLSRTDYCGFEGMERIGAVETVLRRGAVVVREGTVVEDPGPGAFISRAPTH